MNEGKQYNNLQHFRPFLYDLNEASLRRELLMVDAIFNDDFFINTEVDLKYFSAISLHIKYCKT